MSPALETNSVTVLAHRIIVSDRIIVAARNDLFIMNLSMMNYIRGDYVDKM